eukprot:8095-Heterococcus_DN1.PRE.2
MAAMSMCSSKRARFFRSRVPAICHSFSSFKVELKISSIVMLSMPFARASERGVRIGEPVGVARAGFTTFATYALLFISDISCSRRCSLGVAPICTGMASCSMRVTLDCFNENRQTQTVLLTDTRGSSVAVIKEAQARQQHTMPAHRKHHASG